MAFASMLKDTLTIHRANGETIENVKGSVQKNKIYIQRSDILIESKDRIQRSMSNGGVEEYVVIEPGFHEGLGSIKAGYQMTVEKIQGENESSTNTVKDEVLNNKVFIVHGHDELAKITLARFLEQGGLDPIILHEQASSSQTIIEKIESHSDVGYAIVLYTPCDAGAKSGSKLVPRARQNVVFEHGYFIGKLGRSKVTALVKGHVETPNDISGVVYIDLDDRGAWKMDVAKELNNAGFSFDLSKAM
ncbi:nucleotide-binding protein [Shewanella sp. D64]|uniref:nucleotide-binding protein n=1 Tax=unclassified Shewanella TaxID=196818 RepID=UPI0022BA4F96|nr:MULTISPECIES: nucleotide-binding protein [unclassified Shewanella]MEC4724554.1 nucleotide-binding protein [Shewanella sp. D64]MEC4736669.1 nucleotide-binding protein [Shewanella sp. E94]WBJ94661.1 nucleotide-binding protein [Shewanella sp. MTB7]